MLSSNNAITWKKPLFLGPCTPHVSFPFSGCPIFYLIQLIHLISPDSWPVEISSEEQGGLLLIKWSKTTQNHRDTVTLPLPFLGSSPLCPITALTTMIHVFPAEPNDPLFLLPCKRGLVPLTDLVARKHLKLLSQALEIALPLTFHAFCRAGASWAFHNDVPLEFIKKHGTWKSNAIHTNLVSYPSLSSPFSRAFAASLCS